MARAAGGVTSGCGEKPGLHENQHLRTQLEVVKPVFKIDSNRLLVGNLLEEQPLAVALGEGGAIPDQTQVRFDMEFPLGLVATETRVSDVTQLLFSNVNVRGDAHVERAVTRVWYKAWQLMIVGNPSNAGEFMGWRDARFTTPRQTIDASGGFALQMLDQLQSRVRARNGFGNFLYMLRSTYDQIRALCYAAGFQPQYEPFPVPDGAGGTRPQAIMHWNGWPLFYCDDPLMPDLPGGATEIYAGVLGWDGVGWISPTDVGESLVSVKRVLVSGVGQETFRVELPIATFRNSEDAIARITNIPRATATRRVKNGGKA